MTTPSTKFDPNNAVSAALYTSDGAVVGTGNPLPVAGTLTGNVTLGNLSLGNVTITGGNLTSAGNITGGNIAVTSGNIAISNKPDITGNVTATVASTTISSGNIAISNKPDVTGNVTAIVASTVVSSGNIAATVSSGNITATVSSGNITATVSSGNLAVSSVAGNVTTQGLGTAGGIVTVQGVTGGTPFNDSVYDASTAKVARVTSYNSLVVEERVRLVGPTLAGALSAAGTTADNFWSLTRGTNSTGVLASGLVTLTGLTTNADWCQLTSIRKARYITGNMNVYRGLIQCASVAAANTTTFIGAISLTSGAPQNGHCFAISGAGVVSVQAYSAGAATLNLNSGFNGSLGSTYSVPDTNFHSWEILYSTSNVFFYVDGVLLHHATVTTTLFSPVSMSNNASVAVLNGTSPTSRVVVVGVNRIDRVGKETARPQTTYIGTANGGAILKTGAGCLHNVIIGQSVNNANIAIYDGISAGGTLMGNLTMGSASLAPVDINFDADFYTGLFVVTTGTNGQTTIIYD